MSHEAVFWALRQRVASPAHGFVLALLADAADASGLCWPSIERLCRLSRAGRATVKRALADFADPDRPGGPILEVRSRFQDGRQLPNIYRLRLDAGVPLAECVAEEARRRAAPPVDKGGAHHEPPQQNDPETPEGGAHHEPPGGLTMSHQEPPQEPEGATRLPLVIPVGDAAPVDNSAPNSGRTATPPPRTVQQGGAAPSLPLSPVPLAWQLRRADWDHARERAIRRYGVRQMGHGAARRYWAEVERELAPVADRRVWLRAVDVALQAVTPPTLAQWRWALAEVLSDLGPEGLEAAGERLARTREVRRAAGLDA